MKIDSKENWEKINNFLLAVSSEQSVEKINSRIIEEISELVEFDNFGTILETRTFTNSIPEIKSSINFDKKWIDLYKNYYKKVIIAPPFNENDFSAAKEDWFENKGNEFINDFLLPQDIRYSACLSFSGYDNKSIYCLILNRSKYEDKFSDEDLKVLNVIQPHISNYYKTLSLLDKLKKMPIQFSELENNNDLLSSRESEVVSFLMQRLKPDEIAKELNISILTVRKHIQNIYEKLNVMNRQELFQKIFNKNDKV